MNKGSDVLVLIVVLLVFNQNGEFFFDNLTMVTPKGFQIEPQKGMVEAGAYKTVKITWSPPKGHDVSWRPMVIGISLVNSIVVLFA